MEFEATCAICERTLPFSCDDEYWNPRDGMLSKQCPMNSCATRERALAGVLFSIVPRETVKTLAVHESSPCGRGISLWLEQACANYTASGYYPAERFGSMVGKFRNEDLEHQTFPDGSFDLVVHLDVMEHLFDPFAALEEIYRTLKPGGLCVFTAPTDRDLLESKQVAFLAGGNVQIVGEPEYHGNPQRPSEAWLIWKKTSFRQIEHRRSMNLATADMGYKNDVYVVRK
jgi:SAM-dependent methyltransferase